MKKINIMRRLFSSLIDKGLILIFFIIIALCISPYKMPSQLGKYCALLDESPSYYHSLDEDIAISHVYGNEVINSSFEKWIQCKKDIQSQPELVQPFEGKTLSRDLLITGLFIIVNFVYFLLWEWIFHASLGKYLCGFIIVSKNDKRITKKEIIIRCSLLLLLMIIAVSLRFTFNINYYLTILLFFLVIDASIIIKEQSLIDIITHTHLVRKKSIKNLN